MATFTDEQERQIVDRYQQGAALRALSTEFHTSDRRIKAVLTEHGVALRDSKRPPQPLTAQQQREARRRVERGEGFVTVARSLGIEPYRVKRFLTDAGVRTRRPGETRFDTDTERQIAERYAAGERTTALAEAFGCTISTVRQIARRHGVSVKPRGNRYREFSDDEVREIARRWEGGESQSAIAASLGMSQVVVSRVLSEHGYEKEHRRPKAGRHGWWKGGRSVTGEGYVSVRVSPTHPFASMRNRTGYVPEHRLVMAEALGRPLRKEETVHHKNGHRADNRLDNLELRTGRHGKGQRFRCRCCGSFDVEAVELARD